MTAFVEPAPAPSKPVRDALPPAILLGGEVIAVSAARSLARSGVRVHALGHHTDPVRHSRACREFADVGTKEGLAERYMTWLERGPGEGVILPCHDEGVELVARHRPQLERWGYRPIEADDEVALAMLDKERTSALARDAEVPTPRTRSVRTLEDVREAAASLGFPCALKPVRSHVFARHFGITRKLLVAATEAELEAGYEQMHELGVDVLATEIIPGRDDQFVSYYTYMDRDGDPLFHFTKRKLRQFPPHFGLGCYHETTWDPEVADLGLRFFRSIGLRGVGNVEFKRDARDGRLKLIECNHRFTAATDQVRRAGIDIPLLAYNRLVGRPDPPLDGYRTGQRLWLPAADLRAFLALRREGEETTRAYLRSVLRPQHFPMLDLRDPMPTVAAIGVKARRRISKRSRQRASPPARG